MPHNPIQVVLNTSHFIVRPEQPPGGSVKDFFANRDADFAIHKERLLAEVGQIRQHILRQPELGLEYAHVILQSEAWAKSRRPVDKVLPVDHVPVIGGGRLGDLLVELTVENLPLIERAIGQAEETVVHGLNRKGEEVPKPSRQRSEVGAIQTIRAHHQSDRRAFSAEEAVRWLDDPRTGGLYLVETFVDVHEGTSTRGGRMRARAAIRRFSNDLVHIDMPIERIEPPPRWRGHRLMFLRLNAAAGMSRETRVTLHQRFLEFLDAQPVVRRILLPPLIESGHVSSGTAGAVVEVASPIATADYPIVGIIDTGVAPIPGLDSWCAGRTDYVGSTGQDRSHGTFIAGLTAAASQMNAHALYGELPCKFFDLALYPTEGNAFKAFYPRGFLDFLEQLAIELSAAKAAGVRVFNMSLSLERQVTDDSYGIFAAFIDEITDGEDILMVLPSGNLAGGFFRSEWPEAPNEALQMLAEYRYAGQDRILQPAESVRAIVTGALNPPDCQSAPLCPASYTRRGPSAALGTKPDVAHIGGRGVAQHQLFSLDSAGRRVEGCGTSYASPLIAKILANLNGQIEGAVARETLIGLMTHHAAPPERLRAKELTRVARDFVGFGMPPSSASMLETDDDSITLLFEGALEANRELDFPFSWPASLVNSKGQCRGRVRLTLVYRPPIDRGFDAEFVRINLDAYLRQEKVDITTGQVSWEGRLRSETDRRYERELIEHGQKWWPVKQYERTLQRVGASSQWKLVVDGLARSGTTFSAGGVLFSVLLTIEDPQRGANIFREMRQGLLAGGTQIADVRTASRVGTRV